MRIGLPAALLVTPLVAALMLATPATGYASSCPPTLIGPVPSPPSILVEAEIEQVDAELQMLIENVLGESVDHYGVVVRELRWNTGASVNPAAVFYAASLFKLPIMVEAFRQLEAGLITLDDAIVATRVDVLEDLGTFPGGVGDSYAIAELLEMMITLSDNSSAIMLHRNLGGGTIDETLVTLGLTSTSVATQDLPTTAADMATLLEVIGRGQILGDVGSNGMIELMLRQTWRQRIPQGLPEDVQVANKTGDWYQAAHDVAIVYAPSGTYIIVILTDGAGSDLKIVELSERVYEYYEACGGQRR